MGNFDFKLASEVLIKEIDELRNEMLTKMENSFKVVVNEFFNAYPNVNTIYWAQWIPGFNDGDPCLFTVGDIHFNASPYDDIDTPYFGEEASEDDENLANLESWKYFNPEKQEDPNTQQDRDMRSMQTMIYALGDFIEKRFGENAFVRVHRDGIEVEDYDCGY